MKHLRIPLLAFLLVFILVLTLRWTGVYSAALPNPDLESKVAVSEQLQFPTSTPVSTPVKRSALQPLAFSEDFQGDPATPLSWSSGDWEISVHSRSVDYLYNLSPMMAAHGPNCEPPPVNHRIDQYDQAVYQFKNHLMTAINDPGYGLIYLTPDHLVDFSQ